MDSDSDGVARSLIADAKGWAVPRLAPDPIAAIEESFMSFVSERGMSCFGENLGITGMPDSVSGEHTLAESVSKFVSELFEEFPVGADRIRAISDLVVHILNDVGGQVGGPHHNPHGVPPWPQLTAQQ